MLIKLNVLCGCVIANGRSLEDKVVVGEDEYLHWAFPSALDYYHKLLITKEELLTHGANEYSRCKATRDQSRTSI